MGQLELVRRLNLSPDMAVNWTFLSN